MSSRYSTRKWTTARWCPGKAGGICLSFSSPSRMARFMPIPLNFLVIAPPARDCDPKSFVLFLLWAQFLGLQKPIMGQYA